MSFVLRAARTSDIDPLYQMAKGTGGGFTNLPPDRDALAGKLDMAVAAFGRTEDVPGDDRFLFMLEDVETGRIGGTCQIFARIGSTAPFFSYRIGSLTQFSAALNRTFRADTLTLCTELEGASEVGGLYLQAAERSAGMGALLARSRYLFINAHRRRFADRTIAELRGVHDDAGGSPFWDGIAGRFFGMSFLEADEYNAIHGGQFIADLMPRHPIYAAMLPESAVAVMGLPHNSGRAAMRMLEKEGFVHDHYIDIFDGGPTMIAQTDRIATVAAAQNHVVIAIGEGRAKATHLVAHGRLGAFRACFGHVDVTTEGAVIGADAARLLSVEVGDTIIMAPR